MSTQLSFYEPAPVEANLPNPLPRVLSVLPVRFRAWAESLQPKIDHAFRPLTQNPTPKRNREYQSRRHDGRNLERLQKALLALASLHESGNVPLELASLKTKDDIGKLVRKYIDRKSSEFRAWLESVGGTWEDLPDGAFKQSGTDISTRLVVIEK